MDVFQVVSDWHERMGVEMPDHPTFFGYPAQLMINLIEEELDELREALADKDMVAAADAFGDILWVVCGGARRAGIDLRPVIAEIARSNNTKTGATNASGKIVKGPNYSPPNIEQVLLEMGWEGD